VDFVAIIKSKSLPQLCGSDTNPLQLPVAKGFVGDNIFPQFSHGLDLTESEYKSAHFLDEMMG